MTAGIIEKPLFQKIVELDKRLSGRFIELDPSGYFIIAIDFKKQELIVELYSNDLNEQGQAIDPETGQPIACKGGGARTPIRTYKGQSAKELGIQLTEGSAPHPLSRIDHALYLGRELQRAEQCLLTGNEYIQD